MDVVLVRWPEDEPARRPSPRRRGPAPVPRGGERRRRRRCSTSSRTGSASPPTRSTCTPGSRRSTGGPGANRDHAPELDENGVLRVGGGWVPLPPVEARLTSALLDRYGAVVSRDALGPGRVARRAARAQRPRRARAPPPAPPRPARPRDPHGAVPRLPPRVVRHGRHRRRLLAKPTPNSSVSVALSGTLTLELRV